MTGVLFGGPSEPDDSPRLPTNMRVLITVKAAPNPSATYGETVCVAGLRLDQDAEAWVRLYPINFRFIEQDLTFKKYDVVTLHASPAHDGRRESWRPRIDSLRTQAHLDGWHARIPHLAPFMTDSMCDLNRRALGGGPSLGLVRARTISGLVVTKHPGWTSDEQAKIAAYVSQPDLFDASRPKTSLEAPRFRASYQWLCRDLACRGHEQSIIDWEFVAFQRRLPADDERATQAIRQRWLLELCAPERDVSFYVGNQAKRHQTYSILGVVYPRR